VTKKLFITGGINMMKESWKEYCRTEGLEYLGCFADPETDEILGEFAKDGGKVIRLGGEKRDILRSAYGMPQKSKITVNNLNAATKLENAVSVIEFCEHASDMHETDDPYAFVIKPEKKEEMKRLVDSWTGKGCWTSTGVVYITITEEQKEQVKKDVTEYIASNDNAVFYINDDRIPG